MPVGLVDHFNIVISPTQVDETLRFYREFFRDANGLRIELDYRKGEAGF